ncbi:MAG TPA: xanthine dehydrogenase family protein molybdopterin-binding subunit [Gaiellaceae bacterium]|nr:xanthine dehydrogenase family protein molybdopterin-binding subunit [Gaiellaceae bacterium]
MSETHAVTERADELQIGYAGTSVPRKEDRRLVRGEGTFADDVKRHGMGYVHFVRSPYAHARIVSVDVSAAEALEGVYGTLTPAEVEELTDPFFELTTPPGSRIRDYALAVGKVRHVGEPVVAVVAETRELARDAADLVEIEYEPLPVLVDARRAQDEDAPILHEDAGTNVVWSGVFDWGDVDGALKAADRVVKIRELHFDRFSSTPLECSVALVEYDRGTEQFTIHANHQMPGVAAIWMGPALRVPLDRLRFVSQDIGGGFGNKITTHTYLTACCLLARKLRRPIQWTEWRTDQHSANAHGNERWFSDIEVAVMNDGTMLGFKVTALDDCGAFPRYEPLGCIIWAQVTPGLYRWRNIRVDFTQVVTNKSPVAPNRGYSRMQQLWLTERIVDIVAHELGLDPVEVRKRNYVRADEMPYTTPNGCVYDSGDYARCLDMALELIDYERVKEQRGERDGKLVGIGIGSTLDSGTNNFGQSTLLNPELQFSGNNEVATIKLDIFGEIVLTLGTVPQGQGHETTAAMVAADILGCSPDDVHVRAGHDSYWNSHAGFSGTYASQFAVSGLEAVKGATEKLALEIRRLAAAVLGAASPDEIVLEGKQARLKDNPEAALPFMACGAIVNANNAVLPPDARDITLNCRFVYVPPFELPDKERKYGNLTLTYATQIHACVVEIDRDTGEVEIVDYAAVDDCGVRIHPQIVEGQVHGATAHGLGAALHETFAYDEDGQLLTANFYEYHVPHALDMPPIRTGYIESPSPFSSLGTKGMGEGGGAAIHAVCAAIQDALRSAGIGSVVSDSHNPAERVWRLITNPEESSALVEVVST